MELVLTHLSEAQISVTCNGQFSHTFNLSPLQSKIKKEFFDDPISHSQELDSALAAYGKQLNQMLFPSNTLAQRTLAAQPDRLLLVTTDDDLDTIPWEYTYEQDKFLVLQYPFVRGIATQRIPPPPLDSELYIVAVPSNPLSDPGDQLLPLNTEDEWMRLKEICQDVGYAISLERIRPPSLERVHARIVGKKHRIVHFMGHGGQEKQESFLYFERDNSAPHPVTAEQFVKRLQGSVFLVTLNACVSASSGTTRFSNIAAALVRYQTPYALGMRLSILDEDALSFSSTFYSDLARGSSVEQALFQARLTLDEKNPQSHRWVIGVPVLYTALTKPATGFSCASGTPTIIEDHPPLEVSALPHAEGTFQGRIDELRQLGEYLTGANRRRIVTIHGGGGQGKTALACEAVERFSHAWSGGVWAISLEHPPSRAAFVSSLARFLGVLPQESTGELVPTPLAKRTSGLLRIPAQELLDAQALSPLQRTALLSVPTQGTFDLHKVEQQMLARLAQQRTLIVLDNAEALIDKVEAQDTSALELVEFIKQLPGPSVSLLVTSHRQLEWSGEVALELEGLSEEDGARLFLQWIPTRAGQVELSQAKQLSQKVDGHPLSLRILGGAFNASAIPLPAFIAAYDTKLVEAENKSVGEEHRHRKLYTCIEISVGSLDARLRTLLSGLQIFHAHFPPDAAVALFDPDVEETEQTPSPVRDYLHLLWQRGLLTYTREPVRDGILELFHLLPTTRPYVEHRMKQAYDLQTLKTRFGAEYFKRVATLFWDRQSSAVAVKFAQQAREDLKRGAECVTGLDQGYYLVYYGSVLYQLGDLLNGLLEVDRALANAQGLDRDLELLASVLLGLMYQGIGQPQQALQKLQEALLIACELGNRAGEATALNNIGEVYQATGRPQLALQQYQAALLILREVGNCEVEAITLNNIGEAYRATGRPQLALQQYQAALPILREIGNRVMEATTLNNIGEVYRATGQPQLALQQYQAALPILQEVGYRAGEATALNNIGEVYQATGHPQLALQQYQAALLILQEVGYRAGEATTLNNIGAVYLATGQLQQALRQFQEALSITREVDDRAMEATTLNNIGAVYLAMGQPQQALQQFQEALPITREVGYRAGEATTLNNIGRVYLAYAADEAFPLLSLKQASQQFQEALPILREISNRPMEAVTLNNIGAVYLATGQFQQALQQFQEALSITREVDDRAMESATHGNIAVLLYMHFKRQKEAITSMERAIAILVEAGLPQDGAGVKVDDLRSLLQIMQSGQLLGGQATLSPMDGH